MTTIHDARQDDAAISRERAQALGARRWRRGMAASSAEVALRTLGATIEAARELGLDTVDARGIRDEARDRLANPADVYVLALIGGTGVGKSSLLNAVAGGEVSPAGVRRPTTAEPVAWVSRDGEADARPLLDRLGVSTRRLHDETAYQGVVLLDLPDIDSLSAENRRRVDEILPRVDAVAWVTDPEKYADAVLHDELLARWLPRLARQVVVLNKADRLDARAVERVQADLARRLSPLRPTGRVRVLRAAARDGRAGIAELDTWLREGVEAKRVVLERLRTSAEHAVRELTSAAGVDAGTPPRPLIEPDARREALAAVIAELVRIVDLGGARRQAVAATRARARRRGTGPLGLVTSGVERAIGRQARIGDPVGYLSRWRERGPVERATEPIRRSVMEAVAAAPAPLRPRLAAAADAGALRRRLEQAVDAALPKTGSLTPPSSRLWPLFGLLQTASLAATIVAVVWIIAWFVFRPPVDMVQLPVVGEAPAPLVLLVAALAAGYVFARLVGWHAGWQGRRWASRVERDVRQAIEHALVRDAFADVDALDRDRRRLWQAANGGPQPDSA